MIKALFAIISACILADNYVLVSFLGVEKASCPTGKSDRTILDKGLQVTVVTVIATVISFALSLVLPSYLMTLATAVVIILAVECLVLVTKNNEHICKASLLLNSAVIGTSLKVLASGATFVESLVMALGAGLGYMIISFAICGIMDRINQKYVPSAFKGLPITVAAMSIIAMVVFAF